MKGKLLFLSAMLVLSLQALEAKTLVVSDVDDTIKVSDVLGSKTKLVVHALVKKKAFAGMSELYNEFNTGDTEIYYLSGSPKIINSRISELLEHNGFPQRSNIVLKNKMSENTYDYKTAAIRELIKKINPDKLIMIGDDGEYDPEVYKTISEENPEITSATYIRAIRNKDGVEKLFFSPVEIAGFEIMEGRLGSKSLAKVSRGFLNQTHNSAVSIKERFCPVDGSAGLNELISKTTDQEALEIYNSAQAKVQASCRK